MQDMFHSVDQFHQYHKHVRYTQGLCGWNSDVVILDNDEDSTVVSHEEELRNMFTDRKIVNEPKISYQRPRSTSSLQSRRKLQDISIARTITTAKSNTASVKVIYLYLHDAIFIVLYIAYNHIKDSIDTQIRIHPKAKQPRNHWSRLIHHHTIGKLCKFCVYCKIIFFMNIS